MAPGEQIRRDCTVVVLGSPGYNLAARILEDDFAFYLAGPSATATAPAATHLQRDWRRLAKRLRQGELYETVDARHTAPGRTSGAG